MLKTSLNECDSRFKSDSRALLVVEEMRNIKVNICPELRRACDQEIPLLANKKKMLNTAGVIVEKKIEYNDEDVSRAFLHRE